MAAFEVDDAALKTLIDMGFSEERSKAALKAVKPSTADAALEWLVQNEDKKLDSQGDVSMEEVKVVRSYKCKETGKLFRTIQDAQLYAEKTGRSEFEESDVEIPPLTEEEKREKVAQIREKIKKKRAEREENEKKEAIQKEKERRKGGQEMGKIKEEYERMQMQREAELRQKEKEASRRERERLRREIARDKAERAADAVRRRGGSPEEAKAAYDKALGLKKDGEAGTKALKSINQQMDDAIEDLLAYRAGGDGVKAVTTLKKMVSNLINKPDEPKFRTINLQNEAFKKRVASLRGGVAFLKACGFKKITSATEQKLVLEDEDVNADALKSALEKLEKALS